MTYSEFWDTANRVYTRWNSAGTIVETRPYTAEENAAADAALAADSAALNKSALLTKAANAISGNVAYLAVASPTTAQAVTQVKALTKQVNALIRLVANSLDSQDGT